MTDMTVANTIFQQLGGNRFKTMTGAHSFAGDHKSLTCKLRSTKNRASCMRITLDPSDTYTVEFLRVRCFKEAALTGKMVEVVKVSEHAGVYCDMLEELFTRETGLYTRI